MLYNVLQNVLNFRDFSMVRRPHYCVFFIGALLVLLAVVLVVWLDSTASHAQAHQVQRARIAQAVSLLESGCLTCHAAVNTMPQIERTYALALHHTQSGEPSPINGYMPIPGGTTITQNQALVMTRLIETGQRILDLPPTQDQHAAAMIEDYLHVYALASATPSEQTAQWALSRLDGLGELLRTLENQMSPYQLARQENPPDHTGSAVLLPHTTAPGVAMVTQPLSMGEVVQVSFMRPDGVQFVLPQNVVYTTHRRGPPSGVYLDSVL